jgi:hypothetical protein
MQMKTAIALAFHAERATEILNGPRIAGRPSEETTLNCSFRTGGRAVGCHVAGSAKSRFLPVRAADGRLSPS